MTDPRPAQYAAERTALARAIHKRVNSSRIGATVPYSVGDAERAAAAVIMEGWTPPPAPSTEVEEFDEWRLTGNPGHGYPPYDFTGREPINIAKVRDLWTKIQSGERDWTDAKLTMRHVTIARTEWAEPE